MDIDLGKSKEIILEYAERGFFSRPETLEASLTALEKSLYPTHPSSFPLELSPQYRNESPSQFGSSQYEPDVDLSFLKEV